MLQKLKYRGKKRRGVALLVVLVAITLLTTIVMEFYFSSRVRLALAVNARDEVKAYYNARSGINLLRLALKFQYELMDQPGIIGRAVSQSNFQLWRYLDLFLPTFVSARVDSPLGAIDLTETGAIGFGNLEGDIVFHDPEPEEGKINLNAFAGDTIGEEQLLELCALFAPTHFDNFFSGNNDGSFADLPTRGEVIGSIIDYIDSDENMVVVDQDCQVVQSGAGGESRRYDDLDYESKNEPFVTLDELLLVPGVTPQLLEAFRSNLTVYAVAEKFYANLADAQSFMGFLCSHINLYGVQENFNACRVPAIGYQIGFLALALEGYSEFTSSIYSMLEMYLGGDAGDGQERLMDGIAQGQMIAFRRERDFFIVLNSFLQNPESSAEYAMYADPQRAALFGLMASGGTAIEAPRFTVTFNEEAMNSRISVDIPRVYTVSATGTYGTASRTITTVADYSQDGRLLYWREY